MSAAAPKKKPPSLYARKLIQKLATLHSNASLESRQTLAAWIIFNRKKCEGIGEGLAASANDCTAGGGGSAGSADRDDKEIVARLILLLRIVHQVLLSDRPAAAGEASSPSSPDGSSSSGDVDKWNKSSPLRIRLGEIALLPLFQKLAGALAKLEADDAMRDLYEEEVKEMMDEWKEHVVFGGPTVWEEYRRGWRDALKGAENGGAHVSGIGGGGGSADGDEEKNAGEGAAAASASTVESAAPEEKKPSSLSIAAKEEEEGQTDTNTAADNAMEIDSKQQQQQQQSKSDESSKADAMNETAPSSGMSADESNVGEGDGKEEEAATTSNPAAKRDSVAGVVGGVDVEVDFEGVEASKVEPSQFLDACKVIASIQITRDLGSDSAMNLSTALTKFPSEVEDACGTMLEKQEQQQKDDGDGEQEKDEEPSIKELLPNAEETLSKISDEVLDLDIKYARKSLQNYKEAIRQQRKARLQCLQLLLASRCEFGSIDAARAFCGDGGSDNTNNDNDENKTENMDTVLLKLKKRKEILVDAMALEGLDVEENDDEEKRAEKEAGDGLRILDWFPGQRKEDVVEDGEPAAKKIKT